MKKYLIWLIPVLVFAADRVTKILSASLPPEGKVLLPGVLGLRYTKNSGIAFSLLSGAPWLLGVLSLLIVTGGIIWLHNKPLRPSLRFGLMLMLGGAVGNMYDRFFTGFVPDMIEVLFTKFAVFNVADACLTVGCCVAMLALLSPKQPKAPAAPNAAAVQDAPAAPETAVSPEPTAAPSRKQEDENG